jgi:hypothetical protein
MRRLFQPFMLTVTAVLALGYAYLAWRLAPNVGWRLALAVPFVLVWLVPALYWVGDRDREGKPDEFLHAASYLCMGWINFAFFLTLARDLLLLLTMTVATLAPAHDFLQRSGVPLVLALSVLALVVGALVALRGPHVHHVDIPIDGLAPELDGFRIAQISDLHVGPTIRVGYVERVVALTNELNPDLIALTGDIVDGTVEHLAPHVAPLAKLAPRDEVYFVLGNHDVYAGAAQWIAHFRKMGMRVLLNTHALVARGAASMLVGGVLDPAARHSHLAEGPRPDLAMDPRSDAAFRLLLAHNPKAAPLAARAGFDLQLSGHTHAGQFFPWTLVVHMVHAPHVAGLSREGRMWVYVSAGTGTWGPPIRMGTQPELTLIRLVRARGAPPGSRAKGGSAR